ncbi:hypothetical protein BDM02DRAFT_3189430 [Thelephora ganbajun]|uniref:Uncharacterized protein n=1 Tax=Thelephora ganbajun TaxID=370292 RepID=A0ACB6Z7N7_THEGA|nr:hypothetical protein BDM02DRAFT_3189430 [Thelephora ganbajun]
MAHVGSTESESITASIHRPKALLYITAETPPTPGKFRWRDLISPFEYKFCAGDTINNDAKLLCRATSSVSILPDWFEGSDSLLRFTVQGVVYRALKVRCDINTKAPSSRGTWVFEVMDQETKKVGVIKDCWVEDQPGKRMEREIVAEIKNDVGTKIFANTSLTSMGVDPHTEEDFEPQLSSPPLISWNQAILARPRALSLTKATVPNWPQQSGPHGILRIPSSTTRVFVHINRAADALRCLYEAGWVHRDFGPGNIIVVGKEAKETNLRLPRETSVQGTLYFTAAEVEE